MATLFLMLCHSFHPIQHASFLIPHNFGGEIWCFVACLQHSQAADTVHKRCYILSDISRMPESFLLLSIRPCLTVYVKFKSSNVKLLRLFGTNTMYLYLEPIIWNQYCVPLFGTNTMYL